MSCFRNMLLMLYNWMALAQKVETRRNTDILDHFQIVSLSHYFKRENTKGIFIAFPGAINIGGLGADVDIPRVSGEKVSEKETFEQLIYFLASCVKKVFFLQFLSFRVSRRHGWSPGRVPAEKSTTVQRMYS